MVRAAFRAPSQPAAAYAAVEAVVGLLALAFHPVFVGVTDWAYESLLPWLGDEWLALGGKLAVSCLLILPQSILLGMTFPLMSAGLVRAHRGGAGESLAMLYFTNSLGAAVGVLASGFILIAWARPARHAARRRRPQPRDRARRVAARAAGAARARARSAACRNRLQLLLAVAFFTGLASFVYEIGWIRMLSLVLGASTHSFELMLATFIFGLALGGLAVRRRVEPRASRCVCSPGCRWRWGSPPRPPCRCTTSPSA